MNLPSTFRLLALAALVTAPVLAQQTQRRVIVVPAGAAPAGYINKTELRDNVK